MRWFCSGLHPHTLKLDDAPIFAGHVDGDAVVQAVADLQTPDSIHYLRCSLDERADAASLIAAGFQQVGLTRLIEIPLPGDQFQGAPIGTLQWATPDMDADWDAWFAAHWHSYQRTHPINPARDLGRSSDAMIFGGADLCEALFVTRDDALIGFVSLRVGQEIGWVDTCLEARDDDALAAILEAALRRATSLGWSSATLEVDDDHPALWAVADRLVGCTIRTFVAWQRPRYLP